MAHETQPGDHVHHLNRSPRGEEVRHRRESRKDQQQADHDRDDEADHLVSRQRRGEHAHGDVCPGHAEAAKVAAQDRPVVRIAEIVHRPDDRKRANQRQAHEKPRRDELPDDGRHCLDRHREQQLHRAVAPLLGP